MRQTNDSIPEIVQIAYDCTITDIGQLTDKQRYQLNKFVKSGYLMKYKTYQFPIPNTTYGMNWIDFVAMFISEPDYIMGEELDV